MDLKKIDKNLVDIAYESDEELKYYTLPADGFSVHGIKYYEEEGRFLRMPFTFAKSVNYGLFTLSRMLAGGRIIFSTDSDVLDLVVECQDSAFRVSTMTTVSACGFTLHEIQDDGWWQFIHNFVPTNDDKFGYRFKQKLKGGKMRNYIIHTSLYQDAISIKIGLSKNAKVEVLRPYRSDVKPILYYGSSVTQGCCVSRADMAYQALISKWNNIDFINHGYSGTARGETAVAEFLAKEYDPSLFVCAYDYNAETADFLRDTHYNFYKTFRKINPDVPVLFTSRADADSYPQSIAERKAIILETVKRAKDEGDDKVYFQDGGEFFGVKDRDKCTIDDCHPNDLGAYRIAETLYNKFIEIDEKFR